MKKLRLWLILRGMKPRVSIRSVLWMTGLVAVLLGWWVDRARLEEQHARQVRTLRTELLNAFAKCAGAEARANSLDNALRAHVEATMATSGP
jgi:hypothetical protein